MLQTSRDRGLGESAVDLIGGASWNLICLGYEPFCAFSGTL
jgi:hypothetical protein